MKTDKFEKTIRQKLESISPDFQESDWANMQKYMQVHTAPSFWQQYGSWLGYAAAASVTAVLASMYMGQLSQNNQLSADVKSLQGQIAVINKKAIETSKADTVYILQRDDLAGKYGAGDTRQVVAYNESGKTGLTKNKATATIAEVPDQAEAHNEVKSTAKEVYVSVETPGLSNHKFADEKSTVNLQDRVAEPELRLTGTENGLMHTAQNKNKPLPNALPQAQQQTINPGATTLTSTPEMTAAVGTPANDPTFHVKTLGIHFDRLELQKPLEIKGINDKMEKLLANRLSPNQVKKAWMQSSAHNYNVAMAKKTEQGKQAENVIPRLNLKTPYRFGGGFEFQKDVQGKTVVGEVLVSKKFSFSAGLSWLKIKPMEFFTEKMFREKNKQDFKQSHPDQVPVAFVVTNINVEPSLVQIPLTVAFRNEMKNDWTIYAGAGANITLKSREKISYNCLVPSPRQGKEFISDSFERKMDISPVNAINVSAGIEKAWHPIVIQAEGYIYNYFKPLTPLNQRNGPGIKVKLLYQIGNKM
jgi:hypothetical protein